MGTTVNPETRLGAVNARRLGCKSYFQDPTFDCQSRVQLHFDRQHARTRGRFRDGQNIYFDGSPWYFRGELGGLRTRHGTGSGIVGNGGVASEVGNTQYDTFDNNISRLVNASTYVANRAFITLESANALVDGFTAQGIDAATYVEMVALKDQFPAVGIWVPGSESGTLTTGKIHGNYLCASGFRTGVRLGGLRDTNGDILYDGLSEHGDDFVISGELFTTLCQIGFSIESVQAINTEINFLHCQGCGTGVYLRSGGTNSSIRRMYFGELTYNSYMTHIPPVAMIEVGSRDTSASPYSFNAEGFTLDFLDVDGSVQNTPIIKSHPGGAGGHGRDVIHIRGGHIPPGYGYAGTMKSGSGGGPYTWLKPAMLFRGHRHYILEGVTGLQEGMGVLANTSQGSPMVTLKDCTFAPKLASGSSGIVVGVHDPTLFVNTALSVAAGAETGSLGGAGNVNHYGSLTWANGLNFDSASWATYWAEEKYGTDGVRSARRRPTWAID